MIGKINSTINFGSLYRGFKPSGVSCARAGRDTFEISSKKVDIHETSTEMQEAEKIKNRAEEIVTKADELKKRAENLYKNRKNNGIKVKETKHGNKQISFDDKESKVTCTFHSDKKNGRLEAQKITVENENGETETFHFIGNKSQVNEGESAYFLTVYETKNNGAKDKYLFEDESAAIRTNLKKQNTPILRTAFLNGKKTGGEKYVTFDDVYYFSETGAYICHTSNTPTLM